MVPSQYLRIVWARKWLVLGLFLLVAAAGITTTLLWPKQYTAETSLVVEMRIDPALGALAPALAAPSYMATQVEVLKSERVASRAVKILGVERSPTAVAQWREATAGEDPARTLFRRRARARTLGRADHAAATSSTSASRPPIRSSPRPPPTPSPRPTWTSRSTCGSRRRASRPPSSRTSRRSLRANLEKAQATLSKFQQTKGIVVTDERLDQENARYSALHRASSPLAQAERVETATRQRNTGSETSPDVLQSGAVQGLKAQLAAARNQAQRSQHQLGKNHPTRLQLEAQIAELKRQLAAETRRVSGGTSVSSRGSSQKVGELQTLVDEQKKLLLVAARRQGPDRRLPARRRGGAARLRRRHDAPHSDQHGRAEQPGQHAPAQPGGRAARAVAAEDPDRHRRLARSAAWSSASRAALAMETDRPPRPPARGPDR